MTPEEQFELFLRRMETSHKDLSEKCFKQRLFGMGEAQKIRAEECRVLAELVRTGGWKDVGGN
jgi:hypothetical protein